jgi:hypothetical protein
MTSARYYQIRSAFLGGHLTPKEYWQLVKPYWTGKL